MMCALLWRQEGLVRLEPREARVSHRRRGVDGRGRRGRRARTLVPRRRRPRRRGTREPWDPSVPAAPGVRGDPSTSVARVGGVASASPGDGGTTP